MADRYMDLVEAGYGERLLALALIARERGDIELSVLLVVKADEALAAATRKTTDVEAK
jgi:hypothetical protein